MRLARRNTVIPKGRPEWTVYYEVDPRDPPSIAQVAEAYTRNVKARERSEYNASYPLREVLASTRPGNFLRYPNTPEFRKLVASMRKRGFTQGIMLEFDRKGNVKVGEGNHRMAAWLSLHPDLDAMVPVRYAFNYYAIDVVPELNWSTFNDPIARDRYYAREEAALEKRRAKPAEIRRTYAVTPATDRSIDDLMDLLDGPRRR